MLLTLSADLRLTIAYGVEETLMFDYHQRPHKETLLIVSLTYKTIYWAASLDINWYEYILLFVLKRLKSFISFLLPFPVS